MLPTMILAAGLGTRLKPLTDWLPKPLMPVGDRPAIDHIRTHLAAAGCRPLVLNTFHLPTALIEYADHHDIAVSHETTLLGTAGGVRAAASQLGGGAVLVWNGDILAKPDLAHGMRSHVASGVDATLWVREVAAGQGNVGFSAEGRVVRLRQERFNDIAEDYGGEFSGIHIIGGGLRDALPTEGCLVSDVYLPALRRGARLGVATVKQFTDIGSIASYAAANFSWLQQHKTSSSSNYIAPNAHVGSMLDDCIVGEGAHVESHVALRRCIVWPGTHVEGPYYDCILTPSGFEPFVDH
jgi:mannose-1-phosphate guanylyltransferase